MSKVRQIIKLYSQGIGKRRIGERLGMSKNTVRFYLEALNRLQTTWDELLKLTDFDLNQRIHPPNESVVNSRVNQAYDFFPEMKNNLRTRGMTVAKQHNVFTARHPDGLRATAFYKYYRKWKKQVYPVMHIEHKVGDMMYVDYAGETLAYVETDTGEIKKAQVFLAILGWSQYTYVEAMPSQRVEDFIAACENALRYFKGVPLGIMPDNLKSAVFKPNNYEPELNENFKAFADHYGIAIVPARSRKPQDKAHVENIVKITYQRIYTNLPDKEVLSLTDLNSEIKKHLSQLNAATLTGKECSRLDQWMLELPTLQALPEKNYELRTVKQVTVQKNGHVLLHEDRHHYSVPYELIGTKVKLHYSRTQVEIYENYQLVASHKRVRSPGNYTTVAAHMPAQHRYLTQWSPEFFKEKARVIDPIVEDYISQIFQRKPHPQQAYKACLGILNLGKRLGNDRLIKACKRAQEIGYYSYKTIESILQKNYDRYEDEPVPTHMPAHDNIRGANYYE